MKTGWLLSLAAFVVHASAKRVQIQQLLSAKGNETAEDALAEQGSIGENIAFSSTHEGCPDWKGLVNDLRTQLFKVKVDEKYLLGVWGYKVDLEAYYYYRANNYRSEGGRRSVDAREFKEHVKNARVMTVTNHFVTMHSRQTAILKDVNGDQIGDYTLFTPHVINHRYTWRVAKTADAGAICFTIQKRMREPVLEIYEGAVGDNKTPIYYGVGGKEFASGKNWNYVQFYRSEADYKENKEWVAKVFQRIDPGQPYGGTIYSVEVNPGVDAFLILFATTALDATRHPSWHVVSMPQRAMMD